MKARRSIAVVGADTQRRCGKRPGGNWRKHDEKGEGAGGDGGVGDGGRAARGKEMSEVLGGEDGESVGDKYVDRTECCEPSRLPRGFRRRESMDCVGKGRGFTGFGAIV